MPKVTKIEKVSETEESILCDVTFDYGKTLRIHFASKNPVDMKRVAKYFYKKYKPTTVDTPVPTDMDW